MSSASDQELLIGHIPEVTRQGDLSELWAYIQQGVSIIHSDPDIKLSAAAFMDLHTAIWRFITHKAGDNRIGSRVEAGQGLYRRLSEFLTHHLRDTLNDLQVYEGDTLLDVYLNTKDKFHKAAKRVDILFRSLNQHWVKRSVEEGKQGIYEVHILHFVKWRSDLWEKVSDRLINFTRENLKSQSHEEMGDSVNNRLVQPLTALHLVDSPSHDNRQDIRYGLEKPFEKEIQAFNNQISKWVRQDAQRLPVTASADTQVHQNAED